MKNILVIYSTMLLVASCTQSPTQFNFTSRDSRSAEIWDGAHNTETGNACFYFLPPMVKMPSTSGVFDPSLSPVVEVRELEGVPGSFTPKQNIVFSASGSAVSVNIVDEQYHVNWKTTLSNLDANKFYRISVLVSGTVLGFADVDVCNTGKEFKNVNTDEFIPLKDDRTLPVKFRIEKGAVAIFPPEGLFAWYKAEGTADDEMGSYDASWLGTPAYTQRGDNLAFVISATPDYTASNSIVLPNVPAFDFSPDDQYSYSFWMNVNQNPNDWFQPIIVKYDALGNWVWGIWVESDRLIVGRHQNNKSTGSCITAQQWIHVAATYNNGVHNVYINGQEQTLSGANVEIAQSSNAVSFGAIYNEDGVLSGIYEGGLDEVMFFNRELAAAEAQVLAQR